ncbi:MAG: alpha/beta fold hydrolase, partial [Desulfocapsaceae bacterium]|nr:alpha/beta fold hydrolase [Desulfocapsaceae bacterium]
DRHFSATGNNTGLAIVSHGLEGHSRKKYPLGMARCLTENGWDVVCLNFRGCSGESNRLPRLYHSGVTDDLHTVLRHCLVPGNYRDVVLIGFSMGGNQTLKYLGENPGIVPPQVKAAVVFSVPCMLADSVEVMNSWQNSLYMRYFLKSLGEKIRIKADMFPGLIDTTGIEKIRTFAPFDDRFTAPLHGFRDAADYYRKCSARQFLSAIQIPCLMVQAIDDPFLSPTCFPLPEAEKSPYLSLEMPEFGGHVGFRDGWRKLHYWSEYRVIRFLHHLGLQETAPG